MIIGKWELPASDFASLTRFDNYRLHEILCNDIFNDSPVRFDISKQGNVITILTLSPNQPFALPHQGKFVTKTFDPNPSIGDMYRLEVKLNAIMSHTIDGRKSEQQLKGQAQITKWLSDRMENWGIKPLDISVGGTQNSSHLKPSKNGNDAITIPCDWHNVTICCEVVDALKFKQMLHEGIGKKRGLGYGMIKAFRA